MLGVKALRLDSVPPLEARAGNRTTSKVFDPCRLIRWRRVVDVLRGHEIFVPAALLQTFVKTHDIGS